MSRVLLKVLSFMTLSLLIGCGSVDEGFSDSAEEDVAESVDALTTHNALTPNALTPNALTPNALTPNALSAADLASAPLAPGALQASAAKAIRDPGEAGERSRAFLKYAVGCALGPEDSFEFSWKDADGEVHDESYAGQLGLAPRWMLSPLSKQERRWVSACLIARVNWFGTSVLISSRGSHDQLAAVGQDELETFTYPEGAFWGNVFSTTPIVYACHHASSVKHARASQRVCAAGLPNGKGGVDACGIIQIVGACEDHCAPFDGGETHHPGCRADLDEAAPFTDEVITVWLR